MVIGDDGDSMDYGRFGIGDCIGYGVVVVEFSGKLLGGFYVEIGFDFFDEFIEEGDVFVVLVGLVGVEIVGDDKDGGVVGESVEVVVREGVVLVDVFVVDDFLGVVVELVLGEDEFVGKVVVVVVGDFYDVLVLFVVDGDGVLLVLDGVGFVVVCGLFGYYGVE